MTATSHELRTVPSGPATTPPEAAQARPAAVEIASGAAARALLADPRFQAEWDRLALDCPGTTAFQARPFTSIWMDVRRALWRPVVAMSRGIDGGLDGLLVLAANEEGTRLVAPGEEDAATQGWLVRPGAAASFPAAALAALRRTFARASLRLGPLPANAAPPFAEPPAGATATTASRYLRDLDAGLPSSLLSRSNRSKLNRLRRRGDLVFERIDDPAAFARLLDEAAPLADLRHGARRGVLPFGDDAMRRPFLEALFRVPGLVHATALRAGGRLAAAHVGIAHGTTLSLGLLVHDPSAAHASPGKVHLHLLHEALLAEGFRTLDLGVADASTAWKARFATRTETVALLRAGGAPVAEPAPLRDRPRDRGAADALSALRRLPRWFRSTDRAELFSLDAAAARRIEPSPRVLVNHVASLLRFVPSDAATTRESFLREANARIESGETFATVVADGFLVAWGWCRGGATAATLPAVGRDVPLPAGAALVHGIRVAARAAGEGLETEILCALARDAAERPACASIAWAAGPGDAALAAASKRLGARLVAQPRRETFLGRTVPQDRRRGLHGQPTPLEAALHGAKIAVFHAAKWAGAFALARRITRDELRIVGWHGFELDGESAFAPRLFQRAATFERRLDLLARHGFTVLPLDEAVRRLGDGTLPPKSVVLTIDDGAASTLLAAEALAARRLPATVYVTTYHVAKGTPALPSALRWMAYRTDAARLDLAGLGPYGADAGTLDLSDDAARETVLGTLIRHGQDALDEPGRQALLDEVGRRLRVDWASAQERRAFSMLTPREIAILGENGLDAQLHTHRHRFPADAAALRREIEQNRFELFRASGSSGEHLCYPDGAYDPARFPVLEELGVRSAVTCELGLNPRGTDRYRLRRFLDGECVAGVEFEAEMSGFAELVRRALRGLAARRA